MGRIIALANQKGGVGKTTTTISLGAALGELGVRVLLVDFDPQGALSVGVGVNAMELEQTVYNLLLDRDVSVDEVLVKTQYDGVSVLPGNIDLSAAEVVLVNEVAREHALKRVLDQVADQYDFVLIDCPPSLGLLTVNALTAAHSVIIPLECEFFALRGMSLLVDTIEKVRDRLNPSLEIEGIIATMYDGRTVHAREVLDRVRDVFGERLFSTMIPRTVRFAEAPVVGQPITVYAGDSKGAAAYRALAKEVAGIGHDEESDASGSGDILPPDPTSGDGVGVPDSRDPIATDPQQPAGTGTAEQHSDNATSRQSDEAFDGLVDIYTGNQADESASP